MNIQIATVGVNEKPIIRGVRAYPPDKLYLIHSDKREIEKNALEIKEKVEAWDIKCETKIINAFRLDETIIYIQEIYHKHKKDTIYINFTGGTKVMASAALLAGYLFKLDIIYVLSDEVEENKGKPNEELVVKLPLPRTDLEELEENQKKILLIVFQNNNKLELANTILHEKLKRSKQIISYHLKELEKKGLIKPIYKGRSKTIELTQAGILFAKILKSN